MAKYHPTPEETAECMYCRHRDNVNEFYIDREAGTGSECPNCGFPEESPPMLDEVDLARDAHHQAPAQPNGDI